MRIAFTRWRSGGLFTRPSPRKRLLPKKKTSSGFEFVSGLGDGASAMPAKWSRPAFSFRFYEGKISRALRIGAFAAGTKPRKKAFPPAHRRLMTTDPQKAGENVTQSVFGPRQQRKPSISSRQASPMHEPGGVAGVEDYQVVLATYRAACERWPGTPSQRATGPEPLVWRCGAINGT